MISTKCMVIHLVIAAGIILPDSAVQSEAASTPYCVAETINFDGELGPGDDSLDDGEYYEEHLFRAEAGQVIVVDMQSTDFDPYLALISPSGEIWNNDDWEEDRNRSHIQVAADASGSWSVIATSYEKGETGEYDCQVQVLTNGAANEGAMDFSGRLGPGDLTLNETGEYYAEHHFWADAGQTLTIELRSTDFDPYIILKSPSGESWENDDWEEDSTLSRVEVVADAGGSWRLLATTYEPGETGDYRAHVRMSESPVRNYVGTLAAGDEQLKSGEWRDAYTIDGSQGEYVVVNMTSNDFDTYLILISPDGEEQWDNDDHNGDAARSQIAMELPTDGQYQVLATSYNPGETGKYNLSIRLDSDPSPLTSGDGEVINGELSMGDDVLTGGEFVDRHIIEGRPGRRLRIDLRSSTFDTYLIVQSPTGEQFENDDYEDQTNRSFLELDLSDSGSYIVGVTSYEKGETGDYQLRLEQVDGAPIATALQQDATRLEANRAISGTLSSDDDALPSGAYHDLYTFDVIAGQSLRVDLASSDFDTLLSVALPTGELFRNDDYEASLDLSRVELTAESSCRLRITATSYDAGKTGSYQLTVSEVPSPVVVTNAVEQRVRGVFVGISDYPGEENDLLMTADDADRAFVAMQTGAGMRAEDGILLQDELATRSAVEDAVQQIGASCQPGDLFVFFFSGHGSRIDVPPERRGEMQDPDNLDETLCFHDEDMIDNDFAEILSVIHEDATVLIVLDSCFSGGFSKDVICKSGYMGMFSSHEDVLSAVASKFQAGGYLAIFFANAVQQRLADERPADQMITAIELCQYIHEEYREHVRTSEGKSDFDYVRSDDLGYQQFISDRGGVGPYHVLFAW